MNYAKEGFPAKAMQEYLITIANTSFEAWRQANPRSPLTDFDFSFSKVGSSPLFDYNKLVNLSRGYMSYLTLYSEYIIYFGLEKREDFLNKCKILCDVALKFSANDIRKEHVNDFDRIKKSICFPEIYEKNKQYQTEL